MGYMEEVVRVQIHGPDGNFWQSLGGVRVSQITVNYSFIGVSAVSV